MCNRIRLASGFSNQHIKQMKNALHFQSFKCKNQEFYTQARCPSFIKAIYLKTFKYQRALIFYINEPFTEIYYKKNLFQTNNGEMNKITNENN